jgi:hypothetical protein
MYGVDYNFILTASIMERKMCIKELIANNIHQNTRHKLVNQKLVIKGSFFEKYNTY